MRIPFLALLVLLPLVLVARPAASDACTLIDPCLFETVSTPAATFYVWARANDGDWVYQETNGVPGLQAGGCSPYVPDDCDEPAWTFGYDGTPDTLVY
jgi:hypothetical protein